jgi:hypothetical protein
MLASIEPFLWSAKPYATFMVLTFMVLDGGRTPSAVPGEIWVTGLQPEDKPHRISGTESLRRMDPEVFVGREKVWVFYYARTQENVLELRRAEAGL